jgi:molybdate transport system regulatory protein
MATRKLSAQANFRLQIKHGVAIGPGKAAMLEKIADLGSISAAGRALGMGYRTAWLLVDTMNANFKEPLVLSTKGGSGGGGAQLTPTGVDVLARYRAMEKRALKAIVKDVAYLQALIRK